MKVGTLVTEEGVELSLETSQLRELIEYLNRQEANESISVEASDSIDDLDFADPEDCERAIQAAWAVRQSQEVLLRS